MSSKSRPTMHPSLGLGLASVFLVSPGCSPAEYRREADEQVYSILRSASKAVTGERKTFNIDRPVDTLRKRLLTSKEPVKLDLRQALDVAAENSRAFQNQKERLYIAGLSLTREVNDFEIIYASSPSADLSGDNAGGDRNMFLDFQEDLRASMNTVTGGRIVASFVNNWFRNILTSMDWDASSLLSLTVTQPLMRGAGQRIAAEPLLQAERDVIYAMRDFEDFRSGLAIQIVSSYYDVLAAVEDVRSFKENYRSLKDDQVRIQALYDAGERDSIQLDQAKNSVFVAENRVVVAEASLEARLDSFKFTLGLPVDSNVQVDVGEFETLKLLDVTLKAPEEAEMIRIALARRYDYRTALDSVADAARRVYVAEDALRSSFDFAGSINVPTEPNQPVKFDWENASWSLGFDLDLALDKLPERNAYRQSLINLESSIRAREQASDQVKLDVRAALRRLRSTLETYKIQDLNLKLNTKRVRQTEEFLNRNYGDITTRDVLEAKESLVQAEVTLTQALVDYAIARLQLLQDLQALPMEPKGLRYDPGLPLPKEARIHKSGKADPEEDDQ